MDPRSRDLPAVEEELRRLVPRLESARAALGARLDALGAAPADPGLADCLRSAAALRRSMDRDREALDRRRRLAEEAASLDAGRAAETAERDRRLRERSARLPELGAAAYAVYRALPDPAPWSALFAPLDALESEAAAATEELRALDAREAGKGLLDRMKIKARKVAVRGEAGRVDRRRAAAVAEVAAALPGSGFERVAEGPLRRLFEDLEEHRAAAAALDASAARREARLAELRAQLGEDPRAGDRDLERRLEGAARELEVLHAWAGRLLAERGLEGLPADEDLRARAGDLRALEETLAQRRQEADRIRAEAEMEELGRKEGAARERRARLEGALDEAQRKIDAADLEINRALRRREELRRVAAGEIPYAPPDVSR